MPVRIAILADVHSNFVALERILGHADSGGRLDEIWAAGDLVGYGPEPSETIAALRGRNVFAVAGNHDLAACGQMGVEEFNDAAAEAALWTGSVLTDDEKDYLASLPLVAPRGDFTLVHGSLRHPEWEYLLTTEQALVQFQLQITTHSIIGHSHLPFWIEEQPEGPSMYPATDGALLDLGTRRLIINPGSAGQPRDGDPRVSYILYDDEAATMSYHRIDYDIATTQQRMEAAGLPPWLVARLARGK
jgi:diadenosine tetraphosphatase ApaH/serine/threonine PP2A family protein phosphatase